MNDVRDNSATVARATERQGGASGSVITRGAFAVPVPTPYYHLVPKDPVAHVLFRKQMLGVAGRSAEAARTLRSACAQDPLFYINTFVFTHDPRRQGEKVIPFITWPYQDEAILAVVSAIRAGHDVGVEKSRDMGASWICLVAFEWLAHFHRHMSFLLVSRKETLVDKTGDWDALMQRLDLIHMHQPDWLRPRVERNLLHMRFLGTGSTIDGESTTGDVARGGRRSAILLDEFAAVENGYEILAATRDTSDCRVFNSTPNGSANAFYDIIQEVPILLRFHWTIHPRKSADLYVGADGKPRSPWYDTQCQRAANLREIAKELDIDYGSSEYLFFDMEVLAPVRARQVCPPSAAGELDYEVQSLQPRDFVENGGGPWKLWFVPERGDDGRARPPRARYVIGADVATGSHNNQENVGATNSCLSVADVDTGRKVAEFAAPNLPPHEFARLAVAACRWFADVGGREAFLIWEAAGPGGLFGNAVYEYGQRRFFYRREESSVLRRESLIPGWWPSRETKKLLLGEYREAWANGRFINPSFESYEEAKFYVYAKNGAIVHSRGQSSTDPSGARENHGDRVIADALAFWAMKDQGSVVAKEENESKRPPVGSMAWRRMLDDRGIGDPGEDWL